MASLTFRKLKWWGQKPASGDTLGEPGTYAGAVTAETGDDGTVIDYRVEITGKIDESPSFNVEENESRLQRVLEVATNNLLAEKIIVPGQDPAGAFEKIREFWNLEVGNGGLDKVKRALESYGKPTIDRTDFKGLKTELMAILTSPTLGQSGAYGDAAQTGSFAGTAGPLTGVRVGALGKVTGIPAAELARTTADDYGASVDAIDSATNAFEYDLGVSDMIGARFNRKLEAMINAVACCILSSDSGYQQSAPKQGSADYAALRNATRAVPAGGSGPIPAPRTGQSYWDPSVLALWSGKLDPVTAELDGASMFTTAPRASLLAQRLLKAGVPSLPRADDSYAFVQMVFKKVVASGFFSSRLALRRLDGDIEPSMLNYVPEEICFGPGSGDIGGVTDDEREYFGTGWSTTLTAELVQVAGKYVEQKIVGEMADTISRGDYKEKKVTILATDVADFITTHYMGYVHLRAAELRRPVFAFLCNQAVIGRLKRAAEAAGAADGTGTGRDGPDGVDGYGRFLRAINRLSFSPEGEPLRRLVEPYLVRVATVNPFTVSTLMHVGQWFLTSPLMKSIETRCCSELVDAARTRPSKFHAGSRGTRQPVDTTLASALRGLPDAHSLTFREVYNMVAEASHDALEGHLCNFLISMNRLEDISHEKGARRGLGLGQGYGTQIRVTDQRARIVADAIVGLPAL